MLNKFCTQIRNNKSNKTHDDLDLGGSVEARNDLRNDSKCWPLCLKMELFEI